ncbi:IDEAL domain-containing protein [Peribacillus asahii]|uniref:IDEAL domain-containing protein n=1 Tax=Peribacillus asahii TaxID=228899 RepID=A0A398BB79_9BACI|nr:IDEAL domain-containing protein [Peribacillus asahii]RID87077.1 IDEAL domain-containing protein [Peribacillus asahii]
MPYYYGFGRYEDDYMVPPRTTKQDILALIDLAIDTEDEVWFLSLTDRLKNME